MWQLAPGASVCPWQSWDPPKTPAAPPARETTIGDEVAFVTVTCWSGDVFPTTTSPKSNRVGVIRNCVCAVCDAPATPVSTPLASTTATASPHVTRLPGPATSASCSPGGSYHVGARPHKVRVYTPGAPRGRTRSAGRAEPTSPGTTVQCQPIFFPPDAADRGPSVEGGRSESRAPSQAGQGAGTSRARRRGGGRRTARRPAAATRERATRARARARLQQLARARARARRAAVPDRPRLLRGTRVRNRNGERLLARRCTPRARATARALELGRADAPCGSACKRCGAADAVHARVSRRRGRRPRAAPRAARRASGARAPARHERQRPLRHGGRPRLDPPAARARRRRESR